MGAPLGLLWGAAVGLVSPLAVGATTFQQRAALALVVGAAASWVVGAQRASGRPGTGALISGALVLVLAAVVTAPLAASSERQGRAAAEARAGSRLLALSEAEWALPRLQAAHALDPADADTRRSLAAAHLALAEVAVELGLDAGDYALAGGYLVAATTLDPANQAAQTLDVVVRAIRRADSIWNQYDWPLTVGELRKAATHRPDLPGLAEKLRDAERSYALSRGSP